MKDLNFGFFPKFKGRCIGTNVIAPDLVVTPNSSSLIAPTVILVALNPEISSAILISISSKGISAVYTSYFSLSAIYDPPKVLFLFMHERQHIGNTAIVISLKAEYLKLNFIYYKLL